MKPKIPTIKVPSDECTISIGQVIEDGEIINEGTPHFVHVGEWVEVMPVMTVKEVVELSRIQQGATDANGNSNIGQNLDALCNQLSKRIIKWNWTDLMGEKLPQPYNNPEVLSALSSEELLWLVNTTSSNESEDDRKKDSEQLEIIS